MAVIRDMSGYKLRELPAGTVFLPTASKPDCNRMIDGTCGTDVVLIFLRDLEERAEPMDPLVEADPDAIIASSRI